MAEQLSAPQVVGLLRDLGQAMRAGKDRFNELDARAGDGDLGISLSRGFEAVEKGLPAAATDVGQVLQDAGLAFGEAAASTIGALLSTALLRAGKEAKGQAAVDLARLAAMARAAEGGIRARGKAEEGKKTLLDALVPAVEALEQAAGEGLGLVAAFARASEAAAAGVEATKTMTPAFGRARWLAERSQGHPDPGAVAIQTMFQTLTDSLRDLKD